jgi:hydroxymethylbilane synthase
MGVVRGIPELHHRSTQSAIWRTDNTMSASLAVRETSHSPKPAIPLRVGTRASPLALIQTRNFLKILSGFCPVLKGMDVFIEHQITTTGDAVQDRRLADIGGKGLFAKEIHEALAEGRIDFAVHSLKDLETNLPPEIVLACTLPREDARDVLIPSPRCQVPNPGDPLSALPRGAVVGTCSVRRQSQLLAARPDLRIVMLRGNVQTRLAKLREGQFDATILALAGLRRLGMDIPGALILEPEVMVPSAAQGIVGVTVRTADSELRQLLGAIEDPEARAISTAERALLAALDGSCRTPIGAYARMAPDGLRLTALLAREDGSYKLTRSTFGPPADAEQIGHELGMQLRAEAPPDLF